MLMQPLRVFLWKLFRTALQNFVHRRPSRSFRLRDQHPDLGTLEQQCQSFDEQELRQPSPRAFGRHRVLLHVYSGRRRPDLQFYLDRFMAETEVDYVLHIVSMDIIIDQQYGDARKSTTLHYWLAAIRDRKVIAIIAGPPCETWSVAREHALTDGRGPRPVRSELELWGFDSFQWPLSWS